MNSKNILFLAILALFGFQNLSAQAVKGDFTVSAGVGLVPTYMADRATTNVLPLSLNLDYRITDMFSMSAYGGFSSATSQDQVKADGILVQYKSDLLVVGLRGAVHSTRWDNFDLYGGFMLSYSMPNVVEIQKGENAGAPVELGPSADKPYKYKKPEAKFLPSGFVGATWFATEKLGLFGEIGYGISLLNAGVQITL